MIVLRKAAMADLAEIKEGFSKNYLKVDGFEWKDHERWAIVNSNWSGLQNA